MLKQIFCLLTLLTFFSINSQSKKNKDKQSIKEMCGCFEIRFDFAETFIPNYDEDYIPSKNYSTAGLEWAQLVMEDKNNVSIQHILITGNEDNPYIVKHWRQDWIYENTDFYVYDYNNKWTYIKKDKKEVKGQWSQKVFQVDDSPRYEGSGTWVHVDGKSYWENTTSAPLPRREYTKRKDYNVTVRGNRQEITESGWIHDQNNKKVVREDGKPDVILAFEKGFNNYVKVEDEKCKAASDWWFKNKSKWEIVRNKWSEVYPRNKNLILKRTVDNAPLFMKLFSEDLKGADEINKTIESFVTD